MAIRVLIVDDHKLMRHGLRALLAKHADIKVVGEAADGETAVQLASELVPDVIMMDIAMPKLNGIEATRRIHAALPHVKIVALSMHGNRQIVLEVMRAGASAYLLKDCAQEDLIRAIRSVNSNLAFFSPDVADIVFQEYASSSGELKVAPVEPELSERERAIIGLLSAGYDDVAIAAQLGLSTHTVGSYRRRILRKLGLSSLAELTKYAIRIGLSDLSS